MQFYVQYFTGILCNSSLTPIKMLIRLAWTSVNTSYVPTEMIIGSKMLVPNSFLFSFLFLRKGKFSRKNDMAIHVKKKFPLSETFQEFQIRLGNIRKKLKSNLKSPLRFFLLFLQSGSCSWSNVLANLSEMSHNSPYKYLSGHDGTVLFEEWFCSDSVKRAQMLLFLNDISGAKVSPGNSSWYEDIWGG